MRSKIYPNVRWWCCALVLLFVSAGCRVQPAVEPATAPPAKPAAPVTPAEPVQSEPLPMQPPAPVVQPPAGPVSKPTPPLRSGDASTSRYRPVPWRELPGWHEDNLAEAWPAFLMSCKALAKRDAWRAACAAATRLHTPAAAAVRVYFEEHFLPYQALGGDGSDTGLMTGYYEPVLRGSRTASTRYRFPIYAVPDDLLVVDGGDVYPEVRGTAARGRLEGRRVVPYYDRARIESGEARVRGREIAWLDDAIDVFFLHVQGSGRLALDTGETLRVGFADHNGRPYRSIGRVLVERGELTADQASMHGIKAWVASRPHEMKTLLESNPRYVFFRELPASAGGPPGALGVPLTPRRSLAIDPRHVPLGAPVFVATTWPNTPRPLNLLMLAQDTGGAIQGAIRGDFFWGTGDAAGREAGRMRQRTRMWLLLPKGLVPPT